MRVGTDLKLVRTIRSATGCLTLARPGGVGATPPPPCTGNSPPGFWLVGYLMGQTLRNFGQSNLTGSGQLTEL